MFESDNYLYKHSKHQKTIFNIFKKQRDWDYCAFNPLILLKIHNVVERVELIAVYTPIIIVTGP